MGGTSMGADLWSHRGNFGAELRSPCGARSFVSTLLVAHDLSSLVDDVQLVVSELATNAMRHARTPYSVVLRRFDETLRLEVLDGWCAEPSLVTPGPEDEGGRGVSIVDAVSREWGVTPRGTAGKSVWAEFDTEAPAAADTEHLSALGMKAL